MKRLRHVLKQRMSRFCGKDDGVVAIEAVIILPIIIWAYLAMFTIFDTYRQYTTQQKAVYTISDLISRQSTPLDSSFVDGMYSLFLNLSLTREQPGMRVTVAKYDLILEEYQVIWSRTRGGMIGLQSADVANWSNRLPVMPQDDQIIIVETTASFQPAFSIGLGEQTINNFVFTRPRYATQVCYDDICDLPGAPPPAEPTEDDQA
ncbi:MAG: hypothetical protein AAF665_15510 [Pseudomonadota bacterium]